MHGSGNSYVCIWNVLQDFDPCGFIYIASYSNCYIFCKVYATDILFSPLYTIPFLYVEIYCGVLHKHGADVTRSDTTCGSKLPYLQVGAFKSLQIRSVCRLLICSVRYFCILSIMEIPLCKVNAHFPGCFMPIILENCIQFNVWGNY